MAIAPSKLGRFISDEGFTVTGAASQASDDLLVRRLREVALVRPEVSDGTLKTVFQAAREEHATGGYSPFNSPNERVRVFLVPHLTEKGLKWAVPLESLKLPNE